MKVVILAGGFGTRLSEYTDIIPKPMVNVGGKPILWHIMNHFGRYGHNEFVIACGYKSEYIKDFFLRYNTLSSDFTVDLESGSVTPLNREAPNWKVTLIDTGLESLTGTRVKKLQTVIGSERFFLTYGDGVSDVNLDELLSFHVSQNAMVTMTAVRPAARFGELRLEGHRVADFQEKPQLQDGWVNGGFLVCEPEFFSCLPDGDVMLEREPFAKVVSLDKMAAYRHQGFWQCMDSKRDKEYLDALLDSGNAPWMK